MTDEELQRRIEQGEPGEGRDAHVYQRVFNALRREPDFRLPAAFAESVVRRIDFSSKRSSKDLWFLYSGLAACLVAMIVSVVITGFEPNFGAFKFISGYKGLVAFAVIFILVLQWMDRRFVRKAI